MRASQGEISANQVAPLLLGEFLRSGLLVLKYLYEDSLDSSENAFVRARKRDYILISSALDRNPY